MNLVQKFFLAVMMLPFIVGQALAQDYKLQKGDTVAIEVLEDNALNRTALILPDGQISVPMVGTLPAAGRTLSEVQADVASRLAPNFATAPTVYVSLSALRERVSGPARTISIYVTGAANTPGRVEVPPGATLLQALSAAGGLSPFAAQKRLQLRRVDRAGNESIYPVDYDAIARGASKMGATRLKDGDVIMVPQRRLFE